MEKEGLESYSTMMLISSLLMGAPAALPTCARQVHKFPPLVAFSTPTKRNYNFCICLKNTFSC